MPREEASDVMAEIIGSGPGDDHTPVPALHEE
jgi:hypothetical protein